MAAGGLRTRDTLRAPLLSRTQPTEAPVRRKMRKIRRAVAGLVVTLLVYVGLLAASVREEGSLVEAAWTSSAAESLRPYGAVAAERGSALAHAVAQGLNWVLALAPVPLAVLSLFWLARRDQRVYLRLALALLLSGMAGLGVFAGVQGPREASLLGDYLALPGVRAGWYVLMTLAVVATTSKTWPRATVLLIAVLAAVTGASAGGDLWLAALAAVVVPLLAWWAAGHLPEGGEKRSRGGVDALPAGQSQGRVLSFRPRTRAPEPTGAPGPTPLREAG